MRIGGVEGGFFPLESSGRTTRSRVRLNTTSRGREPCIWIVSSQPARFAAIPWLSKDSLRWILEEIHGNRLNRCNHRSVWKLTVFVKLSCPFRKCLLPWATYELAWPKIEDETVVCRCQVSCFAWVEMIVVHRSGDTLHFMDEADRASIKGSLVIRISRRGSMDRPVCGFCSNCIVQWDGWIGLNVLSDCGCNEL